jgi:lipopolysaccharide export system ATP-binding protein
MINFQCSIIKQSSSASTNLTPHAQRCHFAKLSGASFAIKYVPVFLPKSFSLSITISTRDLVKRYNSRTVVNHVSIEVNQGEIVGLLGPNGAGKTTTFYQVVGLIKPDEGDVFLNEQNITNVPMYKRARMGIGYLPQEASVFRKLSVENNIAAVLEMSDLSKAEQKEKIETLLDEFRLHHVRKSNGDLLSGGERRRTEIARALAVDPKFILLDEPFAGIDPIAVEDIQSIVAKLKYKNIGILITDHNVTETLSICDRAYLLIEGKIFKQGTAEELADDEQVRKLYLGRNFELKRKDWLHEEARSEVGLSLGNIIVSVENALAWNEKIIEANAQQERSFGHQYISADSTIADLGLDDYSKFLVELKQSLIQYGKQSKNTEILTRANKFLTDERDINTDLNTILLFLKSEQQ